MILLAYALSGLGGLVHEVAWSRALSQILGGALASQAIVLSVFLTGLGLGAAVAARLERRIVRPLRIYVGLEAGIALWGFASPALAAGAASLLAAAGPVASHGPALLTLRISIAALVLLPPTLMMGATFPVLLRLWPDEAGARAIGLLYGCNTLAAAGGALLGTFLFLPVLGLRLTFVAAGLASLAAALVAWRAERRMDTGAPLIAANWIGATPPTTLPATPRAARPSDDSQAARRGTGAVLAAAFLSGGIGALLQFGWSRVVAYAFGSSIYALGLTLAACILGLGLGPLMMARYGERLARRPARAAAAAALWSVGLLSLLILPLLGSLPRAATALSWLYERSPAAALVAQFALTAALLLPPAIAQGVCLPCLAACRRLNQRLAAAGGSVYALSTSGSAVGFLLAGFLLVPRLGAHGTLVAAGAGALLVSLLPRARRRPAAWLATAAPLLLLLLPGWDPALLSGGGFLYGPLYRAALGERSMALAIERRGAILYQRDGGDGLVTVRRSPAGILSMQINGKTEASSGADMATQILAGDLPVLLHPGPRDALVIGLASGVTLGAILRQPVASVEAIEIARAVPAAARLFAPVNGAALDDPRLRLIQDDARARLLVDRASFDLIASQPSNPWVAGVANLFTVDFYRLVQARLKPGGVFCQWVQAYRIEPRDLRGIVKSFLAVFPQATLWEESAGGGDYFLIATHEALRIDPERFASAPEGVRVDLRRAGIDGAADLLARFVTGPRGLEAFADGARLHTDDNLYLEWRAPLALFRETLKPQGHLLTPFRESVIDFLTPASARDPQLLAALRARLRERDLRLAIASTLTDADLVALREPHLAAGLAQLRAGRYAEAAATLGAAAGAAPDSAQAALLLGEAYRGAGLCGAAVVALHQAVGLDPTNAAAWNSLGLCLETGGRLEEARQAFQSAARIAPGFALARNNLGAILLRFGQSEAAEAELRAALADDPLMAAAHANLGLARRDQNDAPGAEAEYRTAISLDPLNSDVRFNLAVLLRSSGRKKEAADQLRMILKADPGDEEARHRLMEIEG